MSYATVSQVRDHLKGVELTALGSTSEQDAQLMAAAEAATERVDDLCGRRFTTVTETRVFDGPGGAVLVLPDLLTLTAWSLEGTDQPPEALALFPLNGTPKVWARPRTGSGNPFPEGLGNVTITGTWGYSASVPGAVSRACALFAAAAILRRLAPARGRGATGVTQGSLTERYEGGAYADDERRYEVEARIMLRPLRRRRIR
ncbi:MAG TPA: hypothetical protein VGN26_04790 [Armatimonadota bacterium]|jgi:hypothetical protein